MDIEMDPSQTATVMIVTGEQGLQTLTGEQALQVQQALANQQAIQVQHQVLTEEQALQVQVNQQMLAEEQAHQVQQQMLAEQQEMQERHVAEQQAEGEALALVDAQVAVQPEDLDEEYEDNALDTSEENTGILTEEADDHEESTMKRKSDEMDEDDEDEEFDGVALGGRRKKAPRVLSDNEDEAEEGEEHELGDEVYEDEDDEGKSLRLIRTKGKFLCQNCGKGYTKPDTRDAHFVECQTKKMPFKCDKCERSYARKTQLLSHQKTHTGAKPHQCGVCGKRFAWSNQLAQHAKAHEIGGKPFKCSQCGECFADASALVAHVRSHPKEKKYDCTICGESYSYIRDLRKHEVVHALDEGPSDDLDQMKPDSSADLLTQSLQQSGLKPYGCPVCGKCFNRNEYLVQHMRMHTGEKPHECGECGERFTWHNQLSFHGKQHPGGKVFKCQQCEERFVESSELAQHARIHPRKKLEITPEDIAKAMARESKSEMATTSVSSHDVTPSISGLATAEDDEDEEEMEEYAEDDPNYVEDDQVGFKPYVCECGKSFTRKLQLTSHQRIHTGEKPHACGLCDKRFTWSNQLSVHIKMHHPGEKAFKCTTCEESYFTARELCLHNKSHKGSHECGSCGLVFPNLKSFVKHTKQIHGLGDAPKKRGRKPKEKSHEKEFMCDFCGICFARRDNLKEHLRVHTGAKPFQCDICGKFFRLMGHLVKHKRTHTGEKPYRCETCYKCFTDSSKLARHVQMHTGSRPYICRTCYRYFPGKDLLAEHAKTHLGERKIRKPTIQKVEHICDTCGKNFMGSAECTKCKNCRQITYECGICGDQFMDSSDLLEHTKLHSGDWAYQYIPQAHEMTEQEGADMTGPTIIQTSSGNFEFATRGQGGNLVIDVPAGATQEVIECILSSSDIVMHSQEQQVNESELNLVAQVQQQQIQLQHEPIQQVNPNDMIQHVQAQQAQHQQVQQVQVQQVQQQQQQQQQQVQVQQQQQVHQAQQQPVVQQQQQQQQQQQVVSIQGQHVVIHQQHMDPIPEEPEPYADDDDDEMDDDFFADLETQQGDDRGKPFECPECGKKFRKERWMVRHRRIHVKPVDPNQSEDPELNPEEEEMMMESDPELDEPEMDEDDEDYEAGLRRKRGPGRPRKGSEGAVGPSKSALRVKISKKPKKNGYECTICGKCFASAKWLAKHKDTPHTCAKCEKVFLRAKSLKEHMKTHMQEAKYKCPLCQEPQMKFVALLKHCSAHDEGNYRCPSCNKLFRKLENMVKHTRYHNQGVQHQCETCGKSFWQKWSLRQHQKVHSGEQPYQCETCGKCFTNIGNYKSHNRVHTGEKPYICETCGKAFREGGHLVKHRRTHTGEKPYVCNTCTACFTDSSKLARHKKTQHSNFGKGYKCETCGKCFSRIDNLHTHEKTHTGEKTPRKSPAKARQQHQLQTVATMVQQDPYQRFERMQTIEVEHHHQGQDTHPSTPDVEGLEHPVHTIEILRTPQEQTDPRTDQQFLTLLVQRLNQNDDPRTVNVNVGQALNVSGLDQQVRVIDPNHQVRTLQSYNIPTTHAIHPMHQMQMQRPNVLNQFANVVDDYAIHYPAFLHRK